MKANEIYKIIDYIILAIECIGKNINTKIYGLRLILLLFLSLFSIASISAGSLSYIKAH